MHMLSDRASINFCIIFTLTWLFFVFVFPQSLAKSCYFAFFSWLWASSPRHICACTQHIFGQNKTKLHTTVSARSYLHLLQIYTIFLWLKLIINSRKRDNNDGPFFSLVKNHTAKFEAMKYTAQNTEQQQIGKECGKIRHKLEFHSAVKLYSWFQRPFSVNQGCQTRARAATPFAWCVWSSFIRSP